MSKPLAGQFRMYTMGHTVEEVRQMFKERYGYEPARIVHTGGGVLAGPMLCGTEMLPGEHVVTGGAGDQ